MAVTALIISTVSKSLIASNYPVLDKSDSYEGIDADNNGVRDDIDAYIHSLDLNKKQNDLLLEYAKIKQMQITVEPSTRKDLYEISRASTLALVCYIDSLNLEDVAHKSDYLKKVANYTANTYKRAKRNSDYNNSLNGFVISLPPDGACD